MRRYESVVILDPDVPEEEVRNFTERYTDVIKSQGGEIIKIEDWGFKRLAYLVRRRDKGRYILFDYVGLPALIAELERQLKITEEVMKYISVKLDDEVDLEAFKAANEQKQAAAKPQPEAPETATAEPEPQAAAEPEPQPEVSAQEPEAAAEPAPQPEVSAQEPEAAAEPEPQPEVSAQEPEAQPVEAVQPETPAPDVEPGKGGQE